MSQDFGQMEGAARGVLGNLFAATESVGHQESFRRGATNRGHENPLGEGLGDLELLALEAERSRHTTAARVQNRNISLSLPEE